MPQSAAITAKTGATSTQYNNLRLDVLSTTLGHMHDGTNGRVHTDDTIFALGTDKDIALVLRSTTLAANTALTGVLIGVPVVPALAANSFIISNITASGDILLAGNLGGNSRAYLFADVSADTLDLYTAGVSRIAIAAGGAVTISGATTLSATTGNTLVVDTNTLVVDATNNRVGIGTAAPDEMLHVQLAVNQNLRVRPGVEIMGTALGVAIHGSTDAGGMAMFMLAGNPVIVPDSVNFAFFGVGTFGGGTQVINIVNATVVPTTNPVGGGILYATGGAGTWRGSAGTVTTFGAAGPHCGQCGYDFWRVACENKAWGASLRECGMCGKVYRRGPTSVLHLLTDEQKQELVLVS